MASIQHFPISDLAEQGLLLQAAFPIAQLDAHLVRPLREAVTDLDQYETLVLMGQAGRLLFDVAVSEQLHLEAPFDEVVIGLVSDWFAAHRPDALWLAVYPGDAPVPLGQLATLAGWGQASPLGLTIHPEYGLWLAHRIAFVTDESWDFQEPQRPHPCDSCIDRPCEAACPVGAVSLESGFDVRACATYRAPLGSECEYQCLARNACPVGAEHRYGTEQMRHHYGSGLKSVREWLGSLDN